MSIGPYGQNGVVRTILISASSGVNCTSRMRSRSITESPISGSRTACRAFRIFSCFSASATTGVLSSAIGFSPSLPPQPGHKAKGRGEKHAQEDRRGDRDIHRPAVAAERKIAGETAEGHTVRERQRETKRGDDQSKDEKGAADRGEVHRHQLSHPRVTKRTRSSSGRG